ncbi:hypothetical protein GQ43DRAFT_439746 [Delitschia confertaspora ATCC 74209]|uniref:Exosome complex component N-terminal domain-containing protein n=1 Tax=Delitschia confertaspora ATCC 74209 TaxID=1513339 RepID=A0A9P4JMZ7_9PLEO|nr:hypothetical protein GQ43DRAFT_439746 [Delitschia confertaspora ATCC 74209]
MPISILPPSPQEVPSHTDRYVSDSDEEMADAGDNDFTSSNSHSIVTPGETITSDPQWMRGHGTYIPPNSTTIISTLAGTLQKTNKLLSVTPLRARYAPEIGDLVVGRIVNVQAKKWMVDIGAAQLASLPLSAINLPGGILRRRTAVDELNIRTFFSEGDLLVAEVQMLHQDGGASLHTRSLKYGKLRNGLFTSLAGAGGGGAKRNGSGGVVRSRRQAFTLQTTAGEIDIVLGVNGYIFVSKHTITAGDEKDASITRLEESVSETLYSSENDVVPKDLMREIVRVGTLIRGLVLCSRSVDEEMVVRCYEVAVEMEAEENVMGDVLVGQGAKSIVENILLRIESGV